MEICAMNIISLIYSHIGIFIGNDESKILNNSDNRLVSSIVYNKFMTVIFCSYCPSALMGCIYFYFSTSYIKRK